MSRTVDATPASQVQLSSIRPSVPPMKTGCPGGTCDVAVCRAHVARFVIDLAPRGGSCRASCALRQHSPGVNSGSLFRPTSHCGEHGPRRLSELERIPPVTLLGGAVRFEPHLAGVDPARCAPQRRRLPRDEKRHGAGLQGDWACRPAVAGLRTSAGIPPASSASPPAPSPDRARPGSRTRSPVLCTSNPT